MLLQKGVYPYEDMDNWEKFHETPLPATESFYSNLNLENISDEDYEHTQIVWNVFEIKNRAEYHELHVQTDRLLLADVFENFRNKCLTYMDLILYILCLHQY